MRYKQLTFEQRVELKAYLKVGYSQVKIAQLLGVNRSTVCREIKRNTGKRGYRYKQAHQQALGRRIGACKNVRFTAELKEEVRKYIEHDWSPEQICGWLKKNDQPCVSHETIYHFIYADKASGGELYKHLRHRRKKRCNRSQNKGQRGQIPNRVSIELRDPIVETKERIGDWEIDTIIGKKHKGALVTAVERKARFSCIRHVPRKEAALVAKALIDMLLPFKDWVHTITADNGKEFSQHEKIAKELDAKFYFAHPYSSWERGLNENTNGLIRQYFPKNSSLATIDISKVQQVQKKLNERPRKSLDFDTPNNLFYKTVVALET